MKLYIQEQIFTLGDQFSVLDERGEEKYFVKGEVLSFGRKLHVMNRFGEEVAFIRQELLTLLPRYTVYVNNVKRAEVEKEFTLFRPRYTVSGPGWDVEGNFWEHRYQITQNGRPVVNIEKEWMTWGDSYELTIAPDADELVALAVVVTIDCMVESQNNN